MNFHAKFTSSQIILYLVYFYLKSDLNCTNTNSISIPPVIESLRCDKKCNHGEYLTYNLTRQELICLKCKSGSFSVGGDFRICGEKREWSDKILSDFKNECYSFEGSNDYFSNNMKTSDKCWEINPPHTNLTTKILTTPNTYYLAKLKYQIHLKNPGSIMFGYTKFSKQVQNSINGNFKFFIDYEEKHNDETTSGDFLDLSFELSSGYHSFMWVYFFISEEVISFDYNMSLKYIMIEGIEDAALECQKCNSDSFVTTYSREGWDHCETCPVNFYLENNNCKKCSEQKFAYSNSIRENSCIPKNDCNEYDFMVVNSACENQVRNTTTLSVNPGFCNNSKILYETNNSVSTSMCLEGCPDGFFLDINSDNVKRCVTCENGEFSQKYVSKVIQKNENQQNQNVYSLINTNYSVYKCEECEFKVVKKLNFTIMCEFFENFFNNFFDSNICKSEFFSGLCEMDDVISGWKYNNLGIFPGNYIPQGVTLTLIKKFEVPETNGNFFLPYIEIFYEILDFAEEEYFFIIINKDILNIQISQGLHSVKQYLKEGENELKIIYQKKRRICENASNNHYNDSDCLSKINLKNPLVIKNLIFYGTDLGGAVDCININSTVKDLNTPLENIISNHTKFNQSSSYDEHNNLKDSMGNITQISENKNNDSSINSIEKNEINSNEISNITSCPLFTFIDNENSCELSDIITYTNSSLKFLLSGLKNKNTLCETDMYSPEICEGLNKFIGPIHNNKISEDIFFISIFEVSKINLTDFSYIFDSALFKEGFIYGLKTIKNKQNLLMENKINFNKSSQFSLVENIKILKNLGSKINQVIINPGRPYLERSEPGIIINYSNGDICDEDTAKRYHSYLFITCDKSNNFHDLHPKLIYQSNCINIFEWETRYGCPLCLEKDIRPLEVRK
jgi:hypothetical protein